MNNKEWFRSARFGMMVHFGLYSVLGGEWEGQRMGDTIGEWAQSYFRIPNEKYEQLCDAFNPIYFNADEWVEIALSGGMKYLVVTAKHHEGFALFDSAADDYNVVQKTPFRRDILKELAAACQAAGIKFGLYYSQELDWHEPHGGGYAVPEKNFGMSWGNDWDFPVEDQKDYRLCFEKKIKPQVTELLTNYGPLALIWFDTPFRISADQSRELYDLVKAHQPDCLINSRIGNGVCDYTSFGDNEIPEDAQTDGLYETPATLNDTWGYKSYDQNWKSPEKVLQLKNHLNTRGINYLLNVGPDHLGRIPAPAADIIRKVGRGR